MSAEHNAEKGWFADWDGEATEPYVWQPCFDTNQGHIPCFDMWFASKAECDAWIAEHVIGAGWLDGDPSTPSASCPTCGPAKAEPHPRRQGVTRCSNCKEWLHTAEQAQEPRGPLAALLACRWCGAEMGQQCREWDRPVAHLHQDRLDDATSLMGYVERGLVIELPLPPAKPTVRPEGRP